MKCQMPSANVFSFSIRIVDCCLLGARPLTFSHTLIEFVRANNWTGIAYEIYARWAAEIIEIHAAGFFRYRKALQLQFPPFQSLNFSFLNALCVRACVCAHWVHLVHPLWFRVAVNLSWIQFINMSWTTHGTTHGATCVAECIFGPFDFDGINGFVAVDMKPNHRKQHWKIPAVF